MEKIRGKTLKEWKEYCKSDNVPIKTMKYITCLEERIEHLTLTDVASSFITTEDEGKCFIVNTDQLDEIEKGSVVYLLNTYPEDIHLFQDRNGDDVWIDAGDVDRKK